MNIKDKHSSEKAVSAIALFKGQEGTVNAIQIKKNELLKEHITKVPALLVCIEGKVKFENEHKLEEVLHIGDYVLIEPMVKHWLTAITDCQLLLMK
ncbi:MAG: hypothetical protein KBD28_09025 [Chitinophagaceae bacterium]|jgi:quercetin dioxygenase-like cupin family protein|nr:hypothetical protein [Chitinophagaceae bacterium]